MIRNQETFVEKLTSLVKPETLVELEFVSGDPTDEEGTRCIVCHVVEVGVDYIMIKYQGTYTVTSASKQPEQVPGSEHTPNTAPDEYADGTPAGKEQRVVDMVTVKRLEDVKTFSILSASVNV